MYRAKYSFVVLILLIASALVLTGCGPKSILEVNDEDVSYDDFYSRLESVPVDTPQGRMRAGQYVVTQIIEEQILLQLAEKEGVAPTDEQVTQRLTRTKKLNSDWQKMLAMQGMTVEQYKEKLRVEQAGANLAGKGIKIPESEVKAAYDKALAAPNTPLKRPEQVRASIIIAKDKAKIDKAYSMLTGGTEFSSVAMQFSDAANKQNGGAIDWVAKNDPRLPPVIVDNVWSVGVGKFSKPIALDAQIAAALEGKYVIVKADQKRPEKVQKYADLKDLIREQLAVSKGIEKNKVGEKVQRFVQDAEIKINATDYEKVAEKIKENAAATLKKLSNSDTPVAAPKPK